MFRHFICPYCFTKNNQKKIEYRCRNPRCPKEPDLLLARYLDIDERAAPFEHKVGKIPDKFTLHKGIITCNHCKEATNREICPSCHNSLPDSTRSGKVKIISLVGTRDSGKSIFVAVLLHELKKKIAPMLNGEFSYFSMPDAEQYKQRFFKYIYEDHVRIPQTQSNIRLASISRNRPILTRFKKEYSRRFRKNYIDESTLVFFDAAGEDFEDADVMNRLQNYIAHSDGIIFLIDPLSNQTVRNSLHSDIVNTASTIAANSVSTPQEVISRVATLVREKNNIKDSSKKITIPTAVAYSKLDAIESLLDPGTVLKGNSPHLANGSFDYDDSECIHREINGLLAVWGEQDFLKSLELNYKNYRFFAFSALGSCPQIDGTINEPRPNRIEDAFLWMLDQLKLI
jgi:hypothetical protein